MRPEGCWVEARDYKAGGMNRNKGTEVKCVLQKQLTVQLNESRQFVWGGVELGADTTQIPNYPALKGPEGKEVIKCQ